MNTIRLGKVGRCSKNIKRGRDAWNKEKFFVLLLHYSKFLRGKVYPSWRLSSDLRTQFAVFLCFLKLASEIGHAMLLKLSDMKLLSQSHSKRSSIFLLACFIFLIIYSVVFCFKLAGRYRRNIRSWSIQDYITPGFCSIVCRDIHT